jgi:hypothetical protein
MWEVEERLGGGRYVPLHEYPLRPQGIERGDRQSDPGVATRCSTFAEEGNRLGIGEPACPSSQLEVRMANQA